MKKRIAVLCEPNDHEAEENRKIMSKRSALMLIEALKVIEDTEFIYVKLCPPIEDAIKNSEKRKKEFILAEVPRIDARMKEIKPDAVVCLGAIAMIAAFESPKKFMKNRGLPEMGRWGITIPITSPGQVLADPGTDSSFRSDIQSLKRLIKDNFVLKDRVEGNYRWVNNLEEYLTNPPKFISVDAETYNKFGLSALNFANPGNKCLATGLCPRPGYATCVPTDPALYEKIFGNLDNFDASLRDLKRVLENPKISKTGHNFKYDVHMLRECLGINARIGWRHDTLLLVHFCDENMKIKSLAEATKRWVPEMAGYSDAFDRDTDKSRMQDVPPEKLLSYLGGDVDAGYRLTVALANELAKDKRHFQVYRKIAFPANVAFVDVEKNGLTVNKDRVRALTQSVDDKIEELYIRLIDGVNPEIIRNHLENPPKSLQKKNTQTRQILSFTRHDFVRDILFDDVNGFQLDPIQFTKSTEALSEEERVPSISSKQHVPYFFDHPTAGDWMRDYAEYCKLYKLRTTYLGYENGRPTDKEKEPTGFWKHIITNQDNEDKIYPTFWLDRTNTGRTASSNPNAQNLPNKGELGAQYMSSFIARPGHVIIAADLSQIELRIVAFLSRSPKMLEIYSRNGDIHTETAKNLMKLAGQCWDKVDKKIRKEKRKSAKAVNFGFIYGMWWKMFMHYAYTTYEVRYTEAEAKKARELFFELYDLERWHVQAKGKAHNKGKIYGPHGRRRSIPTIWSKDEARVREAERQAVNAPVQGFGSDLGIAGMARLAAQQYEWLDILAFIHDAIYAEVPIDKARDGVEALVYAMESIPLQKWFGLTLDIPILSEPDVGVSFGEKVELADFHGMNTEQFTEAMGGKPPEWFVPIQQNQDILNFSRSKPTFWNDAVDDDCVERLWYA